MEKRLGRGLGSLLGQSSQSAAEKHPFEISVLQIVPNPRQPRRVFDPDALAELASSIGQHGVLQPVTVRQAGAGYELIAGERRWRAAKIAGLRTLPAVVRDDVSDDQMLELALVENVQRQDLDAIERARGYQEMIQRLGITQEEVSRKVGLQRATVTNHLRLLELPGEVQEAVSRGLITMGHARAMIAIEEASFARGLLKRIVQDGLSVRAVEGLVRRRKQPAVGDPKSGAASAPAPAAPRASFAWVKAVEKRLERSLGTRVTLRNASANRGQIVIEYFGREEIDRLVEALAPEEPL